MNKQNENKIEWCDHEIKGGFVRSDGYKMIHCSKHPNSPQNHYIFEHRLVMENYLKRHLTNKETIHHINGNKTDNRIENLEILSNSEHRAKHMSKLPTLEKQILAKALNEYSQKIKLPRLNVLCACGCGNYLINRDNKARLRKYISGHSTKGKHWRWKKNEQNSY